MKYPCKLIQDLLPLYHDGVCSQESREAIEQHIAECPACKAYYAAMSETDKTVEAPYHGEHERQKAASFRAVNRKLKKRQVILSLLSVAAFLLIAFAGIEVLKNSPKVVRQDDISVSIAEGSLIAQLSGSVWDGAHSATVTVQRDGREQIYLFFCLTDNKWGDLITSSKAFTEYVLCPADKGADSIDHVFYYTGDYTGIELMDSDELEQIIADSTLLWSK